MDIFSLSAKIKLDDEGFASGLKKAGEKLGAFASGMGRALGTVTKIGAAAVGAGAVAIGGLVKQSVDAYGKYEQLVGGMETLFKDSADEIIGYSAEAYKTAGMSANQYMETATQFSASLLKSLDGDTAKAAKYADKAIRQMSDNVNKMGTSVEMVQNAYRGFARSNFTMLDNLSLGYAGTKEGMEELLAKAEELSEQQGEYRDFSITSYADIVDAIGLVQDAMGITGTTAKEAAGTVQGSASSMKASWENLVTGLGDSNADLENLIGEFVDSAAGMAKNIAPVVETTLKGITAAIKDDAPEIIAETVGFVYDMAPGLIEASASLFTSLVDSAETGMQDLTKTITGDNGELAELTNSAITYITNEIPEFTDAGLDLFSALLNDDNSGKILNNLGSGIANLVTGVVGDTSEGTGILGHVDDIRDGAFKLFSSMLDENTVDKIVSSLSGSLADLVLKMGMDLVNPFNIKKMFDTGVRFAGEIISGLWHGLEHGVSGAIDTVAEWMEGGSIEDEADFIDQILNGQLWGGFGWLPSPVVDTDQAKRDRAAKKYAEETNRVPLEMLPSELVPDMFDPTGEQDALMERTASYLNNITINAPNASASDVADEVTRRLYRSGVYAQ